MELDYSERDDDTASQSTAHKQKPPSSVPLATFIDSNIPTTLEFEGMDDDDLHSFAGSTLPDTTSRSVGSAVFKVSEPSGNTHRIKCEIAMSILFDAVADKVSIPRRLLQLQYIDDEGDVVTMTCDDDVAEAWALARRTGSKVAKLSAIVGETKSLDPTIVAVSGVTILVLTVAGFVFLRTKGK